MKVLPVARGSPVIHWIHATTLRNICKSPVLTYYRGLVSALVQQGLHHSGLPAVEKVPVEAVADAVVEGVNQLVSHLIDILNRDLMSFATLSQGLPGEKWLWTCYLSVVDGLEEDCGKAEGVGARAGPSLPVPSFREGHVGVVVGGVLYLGWVGIQCFIN